MFFCLFFFPLPQCRCKIIYLSSNCSRVYYHGIIFWSAIWTQKTTHSVLITTNTHKPRSLLYIQVYLFTYCSQSAVKLGAPTCGAHATHYNYNYCMYVQTSVTVDQCLV